MSTKKMEYEEVRQLHSLQHLVVTSVAKTVSAYWHIHELLLSDTCKATVMNIWMNCNLYCYKNLSALGS